MFNRRGSFLIGKAGALEKTALSVGNENTLACKFCPARRRPARAGQNVFPRERADHPHVPGEHFLNTHHPLHSRGLSPRAWGARSSRDPALLRHRFIPTCVGSTRDRCADESHRPVHPHVRGEHVKCLFFSVEFVGSSPRAWGALAPALDVTVIGRFIPTCVGSTRSGAGCHSDWSVHPHVRGEHIFAPSTAQESIGSSPRAWGARRHCSCNNISNRFIPTCVGSTLYPGAGIQQITVHPHVRGEHIQSATSMRSYSGSSPRAWGAHPVGNLNEVVQRFIPTCVGSTPRQAH